jgi:hypothetical protein
MAEADIPARDRSSKSLETGVRNLNQWKATSFLIATASGVSSVNGYACDGLGLHAKHRAKWYLTHFRLHHLWQSSACDEYCC